MNKKTLLLVLLIQLSFLAATAQNGFLSGIVRDEANHPVQGASVTNKNTGETVLTDSLGAFRFPNLPAGDYQLEIKRPDFKSFTENVHHDVSDQSIQISVTGIAAETATNVVDNIPTVSLSDDDMRDAGSSTVASILSSARDPFVAAASFNFSAARFRIRGYEDDNFITLMNGLPMNDLNNGRTLFNTWSGLNDVMRSRENSIGLANTPFTMGGAGGAYSIDSRASRQRKQLQVTYSASNRTYDNRFMVTWGSGIMDKGWSVALSYSRRWAQEGFIPGTFYDGNSFFASVEKIIDTRHSISLTTFGAFTKNGRSSPAIAEMFELDGSNYYNPNWGYQNGEKRNASIGNNRQPIVILEHEWKINETATLQTSVGYNNGRNRVSGLDWYEASDPRPDYYRGLPSYDPFRGEDPEAYQQYSSELRTLLENNEELRQIQWDKLYEANRMNDTVFNGTEGTWAKYIVADRVTDTRRIYFNTIYNKTISDNISFQGGFTYQNQKSDFYREVNDLLGADFYVDLNQFGDLDNTGDTSLYQNDLQNPNRVLREGDRYQYNYTAYISKAIGWGQAIFKYDRFDYFIGVNLSSNFFQREGYVQSGVFPENSLGKSTRKEFTNHGMKGGVTYKYNGRNYFVLNGMYQTRAPYFENAFVSPNTRNLIVDGLESESIYSIEGGYLLKAPRLKAKVMGYFTQFMDGTDTRRFWHEDFQSFVNYTLTNIDKRHLGLEVGIDANLGRGLSLNAVASLGQFYYSDRPSGTATQDNKDTVLITREDIFMENLRVSGGPQSAYTIGLNYRSPKFWFLNVNVNYFDHIYTEPNPARRTLAALDLVDPGTEQWNSILEQERLDGQMTVDFSAGYSWRLNNKFKSIKRPTYLNFNLGISNIFNNEDLVTTAFEQLRFDFTDNNPNKFPARYGYGFGRTFFLNIVFRMN